jgi:hypothetical protein
VIIRNSIIRGENYTSAGQCLINAVASTVSNLKIYDSEIVPEYPSVNDGAGICGHDFVATRLNIHGEVDGVDIFGSNATVSSSWIHNLPFYPVAPDHPNGSHNDGIQISGGSGGLITGNNIAGGPNMNAAVFVAQGMGAVTGLVISSNLLDYGTYTVKLNPSPRPSLALVVIKNNYIGSHQTYGKYAALVQPNAAVQYVNNVWLATGLPAPAQILP